ncbi:MAG TPA: GyrI-like domain-containing protein [Bacteroidales bacterium]|nr:GyrI-like domain-containing protein [Bacteroidales bacterium]
MKHEWKKAEKQYYLPKNKPEIVKIPQFKFFSVMGQGDPNNKAFQEYIGVLYSLSYAVKMSQKNGFAPDNYSEYSVYPLEGVWDLTDEAKKSGSKQLDKSQLVFTLMIRQPDFVTEEFALEAIEKTKKKKYHPLLEKVRFEEIEESNCIQMMHIGSYDDEPESFRQMEDFCIRNSFKRESKLHREIYISDFRKVSPEKLKTVLRFRILTL